MSNHIVLMTFAVLVLSGCTSEDKSLSPLPNRLVGTWEESYEMEFAGLIGIPEDQDNQIIAVRLVSRIVFDEHSFGLSIREDSSHVGTIERLFAGTYETNGDTLALFVEAPPAYDISRPYLMRYSICVDSLTLGEIPNDVGDGMFAISFIGLPWRSCEPDCLPIRTKTFGTFGRLVD